MAVITGLAMSPVLTNGFISLDDENFILNNPAVQDHEFSQAFQKQLYTVHYKPLVYSSWIIEDMLFGDSPFIYHFNNWLLHIFNTLLVFFCFRRISGFWERTRPLALPIAFFTALLFGIHPLHVESVAWAIERKDVLFGFFYLCGLYSYLRYLDEKAFKYMAFAGLAYILSMLSKSMGISLLAVVFLLDLAAGRRDWLKMVAEKWPMYIGFFIALFVYGIFGKPTRGRTELRMPGEFAVGGEKVALVPDNIKDSPGLYQQALIANYRYLFFIIHTLFPVRLAVVYSREFLLAFPGALIHAFFLLTAALWSLPFIFKKHKEILLFGLAFFSVTIAPILIQEGAGSNFGSDRYTYIPSLGIFLLLTFLVIHAFPRKAFAGLSVGKVALLVLSLVFAIGTFSQARMWGDGFALFTQAIDNYPDNWVAYQYRAGDVDMSDPEQALSDFNRAIELNPERARTYYSRGTLLLNVRRFADAIPDFTKVIEANPKEIRAFVNRGNCYRDLGNLDAALNDYNAALSRDPNFTKALNNRAVVYLTRGQYDLALADVNKVLELDPAYVNAYINRAAIFINSNVRQYENALADYASVLSYEPDNWQGLYFSAYSLQRLQRYQEALDFLDRAIQVRGEQGNFYFTRAQILMQLGRREESLQSGQRALELGYEVPQEYLR